MARQMQPGTTNNSPHPGGFPLVKSFRENSLSVLPAGGDKY
jgi:hypothetical protein